MGKPTANDASSPAPAPATAGSPVLAAGVLTQGRLLVTDQLAPVLRTAYVRAVPVVVDARGRVQDTVQVRVIPAVLGAGDRLRPIVSTATLQAGASARTAGATLNAHARPVAAEAARRGRNTLGALLGSGLAPAPVATPARSRGRRLRRGLRWLAVTGAVSGASYGAWQIRARRIDSPGPDLFGDTATPLPDPAAAAVAPTVAGLPGTVPDPAVGTAVGTVEPATHDLGRQPEEVHGDPGSAPASTTPTAS